MDARAGPHRRRHHGRHGRVLRPAPPNRLHPDIFAKGGDYTVSDLPEAKLLARWGGRAVIVPYVAGRSTTWLIEEAVSRSVR